MRYDVSARLRALSLVLGGGDRPSALRAVLAVLVAGVVLVGWMAWGAPVAQATTLVTPYPTGTSDNPNRPIPEPGDTIMFSAGGLADYSNYDCPWCVPGTLSGWEIKSCQLPLSGCVTATGPVEHPDANSLTNLGQYDARYTTTNADEGRYIHAIVTMRDPDDPSTTSYNSNPVGPVGGAGSGACPAGQVGAPPACVTPPPDGCPPGQVGKPPVCVNDPDFGDDEVSNTCTDSDAAVVDGFAGSTYVRLRVQEHPTNAQKTWVCYRAWNATGSVKVGGRVTLDRSGGNPGLPVLEPDSSGCSVTPVDLEVGPDETPILVGVNNTSSEARACFRVGTFQQSVTVPAPDGTSGLPQVEQDPPIVPDPQERQGNPAHASSTCQSTPGNTRLANLESGSTWIAAYSAPGGPGETRLCVRGQGPVSAGGMLTVRSSTGVAPVVEGPVADTAPSSCATNVLANGSDPARFSIRVTASNPASLCLLVGSSGPFGAPGQRFTLGTSGSPAAPVVWTPDPGTPG
jgi:hypothetical protein